MSETYTFLTEYVVDGEILGDTIEASDKEMAQVGCDYRRPGERVVGRVLRESKARPALVPFDDIMKQLYGRDGQLTAEGKEMLARMDAERIERNKDIAGLIDRKGRLTEAGVERIKELILELGNAVADHKDNTGASCRIDLDGHDCCYTCNAAEDMLRATAKYYEGK